MTDEAQSLVSSGNLLTPAMAGALGGAIAAFMLNIVQRRWEQVIQRRRVRLLLYAELVELVGRCWYDFRAPMGDYLAGFGKQRHIADVVKFKPHDALIFNNLADRLHYLSPDQISTLLRFHTALNHLRGEVDQTEPDVSETHVSAARIKRIARRLATALEPGLDAITKLRNNVPKARELEAKFVGSQEIPSEGSYIEELEKQVGRATPLLQ